MLYARAFIGALIVPIIHAQAPNPLTQATINTYTRYTNFAAAIFCNADVVNDWTCGKTCQANAGFKVTSIASYDQAMAPHADWFVGYDKQANEIIVSLAEVSTEELSHSLYDEDVHLVASNSDLFPGLTSGVKAHEGFLKNHASEGPQILTAIKGALQLHKTAKLTFTGLGVGGAQVQLLLVYASLQLPDLKAKLKAVTYGSPQVGNQAFANYIDQKLPGKLTRINNKQDPTPVLPSRLHVLKVDGLPLPDVSTGDATQYHSASGEIRIDTDDSWQKCLGPDNANARCSARAVTALNEQVYRDHDGPYNGVRVECAK